MLGGKRLWIEALGAPTALGYVDGMVAGFQKAKALVICPNKSYIDEVIDQVIARHGICAGIEFMSFDEFIKGLLPKGFQAQIGESMKNFIFKKIIEAHGAGIDYYSDIANRRGFYRSLSSLFRELKGDLISPEQVHKAATGRGGQAEEVALIYGAYQDFIEASGHCDLQDLYARGVARLEDHERLGHWERIIVDGFYEFRAAEREVLAGLVKAEADVDIYLPYGKNEITADVVEDLVAMGYELMESPEAGLKKLGGCQCHVVLGKDLMVRDVMSRLRELYEAGVSADLVYTDNVDLWSLVRMGESLELPLQWRTSIELVRTPLGRRVYELLELVGKTDQGRLKNFVDKDLWPGEEVHGLAKHLLVHDLDPTWQEALEMESLEAYHPFLHNFESLFFSGEEGVFEGLESLLTSYQALWQEGLNGDMLATEIHFKVWEKIQGLLEATKAVAKALKPTKYEVYQWLRDQLEIEMISLSSRGRGIPLRTLVDAQGIHVDHRLVLDLNGDFPPKQVEPFYSFGSVGEMLRGLGLSSLDVMRKHRSYGLLMEKVVAQGEELEIYLSSTSVEEPMEGASSLLGRLVQSRNQGKLLPIIHWDRDSYSGARYRREDYFYRLLQDEGLEEDPGQVVKGLLTGEDGDLLQLWERMAKREAGDPDYMGSWDGSYDFWRRKRKTSKGVTALERFVACPFYYALGDILKLQELESQKNKDLAIHIGSIYHEVVEAYYKRHQETIAGVVRSGKVLEVSYEEILKDVEAAYHRHFKDWDMVGKKASVEVMAGHVWGLIQADLERLRGLEPKMLPYAFEYDLSTSINRKSGPHVFYNRIDRIDRTLEGDQYGIIDYKAGSYGMKSKKEALNFVALQLGVYALGLGPDRVLYTAYEGFRNQDFQYQLLRDKIKHPGKRPRQTKEWEAYFEDLPRVLDEYLSRQEAGEFLVAPEDCLDTMCPYRDVCRYEKLGDEND